MKPTRRQRAYLKNKIRGGDVNQRGNNYELFFAVHKVSGIIGDFANTLQDIFISSQVNAYVDDFHIYYRNKNNHEYYQLKTSRLLTWGTGMKSIQFDFNEQKKIEIGNKTRYKLFLVVCQPTLRRKLAATIPRKLKNCTGIQYFPYYNSIQKQIANDPNFKARLSALCAFPGTDKLEALAIVLLGAWAGSDKKDIPASSLVNQVRTVGYAFLKSGLPLFLRPDTHRILTAIPGFSYQIVNGYFEYNYPPCDHGQVPYPLDSVKFRNIEDEINARHPTTFGDLEQIII
jgi:hypothetical protein